MIYNLGLRKMYRLHSAPDVEELDQYFFVLSTFLFLFF